MLWLPLQVPGWPASPPGIQSRGCGGRTGDSWRGDWGRDTSPPPNWLAIPSSPGETGEGGGWGGGGDGTGSRGSLSEIQACVVERRSSLSRNLSSLSEFKIISANQHYLTQKKTSKIKTHENCNLPVYPVVHLLKTWTWVKKKMAKNTHLVLTLEFKHWETSDHLWFWSLFPSVSLTDAHLQHERRRCDEQRVYHCA